MLEILSAACQKKKKCARCYEFVFFFLFTSKGFLCSNTYISFRGDTMLKHYSLEAVETVTRGVVANTI